MAPPIKVEYAKSARSRCTLKSCNLFIQKGELRIGTGSMMPGADELSYKWRHLCCFTSRQIKNMQASVDNIEAFEDMEEAHQAIIHKMLKGQLEGDASVKGAIISAVIAGAAEAASSQKGAKGKKKPMGVGALLMGNSNADLLPSQLETTQKGAAAGAAKPLKREGTAGGKKRARAEVVTLDGFLVDCGVESDATDEFEVAVTDQKPSCPYGADCYHKNPAHFAKFRHPGDASVQLPDGAKEPTVVKKIVRHRRAPLSEQSTSTAGKATSAFGGARGAAASVAAASAGHSTSNTGKEACPYGAMCVLSSPAHLAQYAHGNEAVSSSSTNASYATVPTGTPSGGGSTVQGAFGTYSLDKKPCPYGELCVLKTPAHLLQFSHPNDSGAMVSTANKSPAKPKAPMVTMVKKVPLLSPTSAYGGGDPATAADISTPSSAGAKPPCPYLPMCLRSDAKHMAEFAH